MKGENKMKTTITCDECGESYEYDDDGKTFDCMPDGEMINGKWYCSNCLYDEDGNYLGDA